ncbi:MAG: carboxypeptidase regulatory-like domain-containing protein, partial [Chitinophagaceae bacterium]|nr:carboxypeptidase regulatory-like domain-containing protein [Chitinophagaceae bacterium]
MKRSALFIVLLFACLVVYGQPAANDTSGFTLTVINERAEPANGVIVELWKDSRLLKTAITDAKGSAGFTRLSDGSYSFTVSHTGYK